jgi:hypothetical protein
MSVGAPLRSNGVALKDVSVVLANGAWAERSSLVAVIAALKKESVQVSAVPLPFTSLADDAAAIKPDMPHADVRFFDTGHSALETHCAKSDQRPESFWSVQVNYRGGLHCTSSLGA